MSVTLLIEAARAAHALLLIDTCVVERPQNGTLNTSTGAYTATYLTIYTGACRVKGPGAGQATPQEVLAVEAEQQLTRHTLVLPYGTAAGVAAGDRVRLTAGAMNGSTFTVVGVSASTSMSARSILIELVDDPASPAYNG